MFDHLSMIGGVGHIVRLFGAVLLCVLCHPDLVSAELEPDGKASFIDIKSLRDDGLRLYDEKNYRLAQKRFIKLVQHHSNSAKDYLHLARTAYYAEDFLISSVAYQIYFELAKRKPASGTRDEYAEVKRQVQGGVDVRKRKAHRKRLDKILSLIKAKELEGDRGALAELIAAHQASFFDPLFDRAHRRMKKVISGQRDKILRGILSGQVSEAERKARSELVSKWGQQSWGDPKAAEVETLAIRVFSQLLERPKAALSGLEELAQLKTTLPRDMLRDAQLIVFMNLDREEDVYLLSDGMIRSLETKREVSELNTADKRRLDVLVNIRALYALKIKKDDAQTSVISGLTSGSDRFLRALKITKGKTTAAP